MAIHTIDSIKVNGSNKFCGAFIYNLSYQPNFAESPSTMSLSLVSEDSTFINPDKSLTKPYNIQVGTRISKNMYCIGHKIRKSSGGKLMDVSFMDGSFVLDKTYVGLHKRHGVNSDYAIQQNWTLSGYASEDLFKKYKLEMGSNLIIVGRELHPCDFNKNGVFDINDSAAMFDPCDPCPDGKYELNPCYTASFLQVLDVAYSFNDLIGKIGGAGISVQNVPSTNNYYLAQYMGPLRSVLKSWGADYGFSFYWEDDKLCFIDVKSEINIDFTVPSTAKELEEEETLEGTISRGAISYIQKNGELKSYDCTAQESVTLHCLRLDDIQTDTNLASFVYPTPESSYGLINTWELACSLSIYAPVFRDAFWFYNVYKITTPTKARAYKNISICALGDFTIFEVYDRDTKPTEYQSILDGMQDKDKDFYNGLSSNYKLYFILAYQNVQKLQQYHNNEQDYARNFLGKFWWRQYVPSLGFSTPIAFTSTDGDLKIIRRNGLDVADVPFSRFGVKFNWPSSMMLLEKSTQAWYPDPTKDSPQFDELVRTWNGTVLKRLEGSSFITNSLLTDLYNNTDLKLKDLESICLFCTLERPSFNITQQLTQNPVEFPKEYGLNSNSCTMFNFDGFRIYTPSQSTIASEDAGYDVLATQTYPATAYVAKHQSVYQSAPENVDDTLNFDVNLRQIEDTDLQAIGYNSCGISSEGAEAAHKLFNKDLTYSTTGPTKLKSITLPYLDMPTDIGVSINDGLIGLDISASENGITSIYRYSSRPAKPVSLNVAYREAESRAIKGLRA